MSDYPAKVVETKKRRNMNPLSETTWKERNVMQVSQVKDCFFARQRIRVVEPSHLDSSSTSNDVLVQYLIFHI